MKKKLLTLLTLLLCVCGGAWATETTVSLTSYTLTDNKATVSNGDVIVELSRKSGTTPGAASENRGIRWQSNCVIKVTIPSGNKINSVKLTTGSKGNSVNSITYSLTDGSTALSGTWDNAPNSGKKNDYTWTASPGTYYTTWQITNTGTSGDIYVASVTVNYETATIVNSDPTISTQPVSALKAYVGFESTLSVAATGYPVPTYQWYRNTTASTSGGTPIEGETSSSYSFTPEEEGTLYFYVIAKNNYGGADHSVTSNLSTVTVGTQYRVAYSEGETGAVVANTLAPKYYEKGSAITLPTNHYFYLDGQSVSKWSDGEKEYDLGGNYTVNSDVTFYPLFASNTNSISGTSITWTFSRNAGAPQYALESENGMTSVIATTTNGIDLKMDVKTLKVGSDTGKFNNGSYDNRAQVNAHTTFTIPAVKGMTVSYVGTNGTASVEDAVLFGGDHATSVSGSSYTYNYEGDDATLIITDNKGGVYPSGITVTYPVTGPADPTTGESKNIVVTFPSGTPTYSENTSVITVSGTAKSGADAIKTDDKLSIVINLPATATAATVTLFTNGENSSYIFNEDSTSPTWNDWDGINGGKKTTIDIVQYAGNLLTIKKGSGTKELYRVELNYSIVSADEVYLTTTANMAGWRSFYDADQGYTLDGNTTAYIATSSDNTTKVWLKPIERGVPAATPVILHTTSSADSYKMTLTKATVAAYNETIDGTNLLTWETTAVSNKYRLGYGEDGLGFYPYSGTPSNGAVILNVSSTNARTLNFLFENETTGISNLNVNDNANIDANAPMYNLAGQKVGKNYKGIVIVNGKKVVRK